jgi:hypothetical protein
MTAAYARVVLRPSPGQRAADLCRDLIAIAGSVAAVRSVGSNGFQVDDQTALLYLTHADPPTDTTPDAPDTPDVPAPTDPAPQAPVEVPTVVDGTSTGNTPPPATAVPEPDPTSTTTEPDRHPAAAKQQRRVPARKAAMTRGAPDGE